MTGKRDPELRRLEISLLLEAVHRRYGYDFRHYAAASLGRRIENMMQDEGLATVSALQERVLHEPACMDRFMEAISVSVTALFRDPGFYAAFRDKAAPWLAEQPMVRIWHAGCATGMEVYSMAILLHEEGLLDRVRLYATDMSEAAIEKAKAAIYPLGQMQQHTRNYLKAGGKAEFSDYYTAKHDAIRMRQDLQKNVVWAQHNLATDASFNEFHAILCRNVMIYFDMELQARVHRLLCDSLAVGGYLGLGEKESLRFAPTEDRYETVDKDQKLYRKAR